MDQYGLAYQALNSIIIKGVSFSRALKDVFSDKGAKPESRSLISSLVGCELRHHLAFEYSIRERFGNIGEPSVLAVSIVLANKLFLRRVSDSETIAFCKAKLNELGTNIDPASLDDYLTHIGSGIPLIPDELDKGSTKYLSLRFNTPEWIVRMWMKNYGRGVAYKILRANTHMPVQTLSINLLKSKKEEILKEGSPYSESVTEGLLNYDGKGPIRKDPLVQKHALVPMKPCFRILEGKIPLDPLKKVAFYLGSIDPLYIDIQLQNHNAIKGDLILAPNHDIYRAKAELRDYGIEGYSIYESGPKGVVTIVSEPVSVFFVSPDSSAFDLLRITPDHFLKVLPETIDKAVEVQASALEECSEFVEDGGLLVYYVETVSKKETESIVSSFLESHKDYAVVESRQLFPFEMADSSFYYCIFRRGGSAS